MGGRLTFPGGGWYHASKHAVEALSDALRFEVQGFGIDVVVIEPGLIRTGFAEAAVGTIEQEDGPYARFNAAVGAATAGVYENRLAQSFGGGPDAVAKAIEKAVTAKRPRTRYRVTPSAGLFLIASGASCPTGPGTPWSAGPTRSRSVPGKRSARIRTSSAAGSPTTFR